MNVEAVFNEEFDKALAEDVERTGMSVEQWFKAGVTLPQTQIDTWRTLGPQTVQNCIDWWESSGYEVWITPDGRPAIELELDVVFDGCNPVKMIVDLVAVKDGYLTVIDTKSGGKIPGSVQQIALYACGIEMTYGVRPKFGAYFMARGAGRNKDIFLTEPVPLDAWEHSIQFFATQFEALERSIVIASDGDRFISNVGKHCTRCDVASACAAVGGWEARFYDTRHPDFVGG